ncbi:Predicted arabinose efflux permease, MFS family [Sphingomonas sp. YR710]|jgi:MFS family permease|uniref:MFS transporter n=1 Tax=Sphingomonas sp. YR710 TaxID=1882773 RepID=UPI000892030C|nr:MFS transporter [Sphingomonas sp. YR710]SDB99855.1 Predicted arabinose efflux permease, MFS family [Sphingomonas sp. YR710]
MAGYIEELQTQWRPIIGSLVGMSAGLAIIPYITATMAPFLIADLGWSKAEFAWVGVLGLASALSFPFAGRLCDIIGTRRTAMIGVVALPFIFFAFSQTTDFRAFIVLYLLQCLLSVTTTAIIYCRIIVQYVHRARGLALGLAASGPAIVGMIGTPLLNAFVQDHGWRAGYLILTVGFIVAGLVAMLLLPPDLRVEAAEPAKPKRNVRRDFAILRRMRAFWIILGGIFLCSITNGVMLPQMSIILREKGIFGELGAILISTYALGMLAGRLLSGVAIDHFAPRLVATTGFVLSALGLFLIASPWNTTPLLFCAVLILGLSVGSEGDVVAYLIVQHFGVSVYSTVFGMSSAIMSVSAGAGAILAALLLKPTGLYWPFLTVAGCLIAFGSMLFLFLPPRPVVPDFERQSLRRIPSR